MAKQNFGGVYANMEFPPYVWQEYPKHIITGPHGKFTTVNSKIEESELRQKLQIAHDDMPAESLVQVIDPDKEILISRAHELGVPINRKWSKAKLEAVVKAAEDEIDNLPADEQIIERKSVVQNHDDEPAEEMESGKTEEEYKDELIAIAKQLGVKNVSRLWGIPRLKATIVEFQDNK
jgi:hypothetical protein